MEMTIRTACTASEHCAGNGCDVAGWVACGKIAVRVCSSLVLDHGQGCSAGWSCQAGARRARTRRSWCLVAAGNTADPAGFSRYTPLTENLVLPMASRAWSGPSGPGPGGEFCPQSGDFLGAEAEGGEPAVGCLVKAGSGVLEVLIGQARIEAPGEADHLLDGVAAHRGGGVPVVAWHGPGGQRCDLAADDVLQVQDGPDLHDHWPPGPVEVGELQQHLLPARGGDRPLGQALAQPLPDVGEPSSLILALDLVAGGAQRGLDR